MHDPSHDPDIALLRAIAGGDTHALAALYARHGRGLLVYLSGLLNDQTLAEEVLQDVMLAVWRGAGGFRGDSRVKTWLLSIARLQALAALRRRKLLTTPLDDETVWDGDADDGAGALPADPAALRLALRQLPSNQQETLELIFYHNLTGAEAAAVLAVSEGTIKSRLNRAKLTLRRLLSSVEGNHER